MKEVSKITPVILAGGLGTRLRPLTSDKSPKPFLRLTSKNSLFQDTVLRALSFGAPVIVCHESYYSFVQKQLAEINVKPRAIILEPDHKGTAAAIALAAFYLKNKGEVMLVLPSDHALEAGEKFDACVYGALEKVENDIVMLGVVPSRAETGYGYIVCEEGRGECRRVKRFVEKPEGKKANELLKKYDCLWNTGIFLSRPYLLLDELKYYEPETYKLCERAFYASSENDGIYNVAASDFEKIIPKSVDYAVMEKCQKAFVYNMPIFWSDLGTWPKMLRLKILAVFKKERFGNRQAEQYKKAS